MPAATANNSTFAWDQYWRDGRLASCGGEGGANYQPAIAEGWRGFFGTLIEGARILDVCSGNGAVARLAAEVASARNLRVTIDAADAAEIRSAGPGPGTDMIRYVPRTPAEHLPFETASFDVVVSQYGIEYTDLARTLAELHRTSRASARVRFVTHAAGSVVVQGAKRQLADAERLAQTGVFEAAEAFARAAEPGALVAIHDAAHARFLAALQSLHDAEGTAMDLGMYRNVGNVIVDAIQQQPRIGAATVLAKIAETAAAIRAHHARLDAMCHAALDASAARALVASAERLWGYKFNLEPLVRADGSLFGWVIESRISSAA